MRRPIAGGASIRMLSGTATAIGDGEMIFGKLMALSCLAALPLLAQAEVAKASSVNLLALFEGHYANVSAMAWSPDGGQFSLACGPKIHVFDEDGRRLRILEDPEASPISSTPGTSLRDDCAGPGRLWPSPRPWQNPTSPACIAARAIRRILNPPR